MTRGEALVGLARRKDQRIIEPLIKELSRYPAAEHWSYSLEAAEEIADAHLLPLLTRLKQSVDGAFDNPVTGRTDSLMEGVYLRTEAKGQVTGRAKLVRSEFVEKVKQSEHWQHQAIVPNLLAEGVEIWS